MASITNVSSNRPAEPLFQSNSVQVAEEGSEVTVESLANQFAAFQTEFEALIPALSYNALSVRGIHIISGALARIQTSMDALQTFNEEEQAAQVHIAEIKKEIKNTIEYRSQVNDLNLAETEQKKREMITALDTRIQDKEVLSTHWQSIANAAIRYKALAIPIIHSGLQDVTKKLNELKATTTLNIAMEIAQYQGQTTTNGNQGYCIIC